MTDVSESGVLPAATAVERSGISVADLDPTARFYREVVGLQRVRSGVDWVSLGAGATPLLVLIETESPASGNGARLYHNAFRVPSRRALGDALTRVLAADRLQGAADHGVSEALYARDPDGNGVEVYRDFPREDWPVTEDGRVAMRTDPLDLAALASERAGEDHLSPGTDLGHVHLEVSSLSAFRRCYVDGVGFSVRSTVSGAVFLAAGDYHHHLAGNIWHRRRGPRSGPGLAWIELHVPDAAALEAARDRLVRSRFAVTESPEWQGHTPTAGFAITDADGFEVRIRSE